MLNGKNAVVTGGSRGIGRAICVGLASLGANVVVNYSGNADAAAETVRLCQEKGVKAMSLQADVSISEQANGLIESCISEFGSIDILVNNAGVTADTLIMRMSEEDFDRVINTNLKGAFLCTKFAARPMMKQRFGRIINIGSVVGEHGNAGQCNYAASKSGLVGFSKSVAKELAAKGVTVNVVAPGFIETDMTEVLADAIKQNVLMNIPVGSLGQTEDIANAVTFFALPTSSYITGQVLSVDGGMGM